MQRGGAGARGRGRRRRAGRDGVARPARRARAARRAPRGAGAARPGFADALEREVRAWQAGVLELVRRAGAGKRRTAARLASFGVNGAGLAVMLAGLRAHRRTDRAARCWSRAARRRCSQKMLEAVFGDRRCGRWPTRPGTTCTSGSSALLGARARRGSAARARGAPIRAAALRCGPPAGLEQARRASSRSPAAPALRCARAAGRRSCLVAPCVGSAALADRLAALDEARRARPRPARPRRWSTRPRRVAGKAGERLRLGAAHTVVALAGATGSGKSSLFNALSGEDVSAGRACAGRRPRRRTPRLGLGRRRRRCWTGSEVPRRHAAGAARLARTRLDGLVLLDLPDHDSVAVEHRLEADRLVELVDLLVWVLDPQKYADAALHERYLRPLAGHADVTLVVLNQVDRLTRPPATALPGRPAPAARRGRPAATCRSSRSRRATGEGLDALRAELARRAAAPARPRCSGWRPTSADRGGAAAGAARRGGRSASAAGARPAGRRARRRRRADAVAAAVDRAHRLRAAGRHRLAVHPLGSPAAAGPAAPAAAAGDAVGARAHRGCPGRRRCSAPGSTRRCAQLTDARRRRAAGALAGGGRRAATRRRAELPDLLDRAVAGTDLGAGRRPRWWRPVGAAAVAARRWRRSPGWSGCWCCSASHWLQLPDAADAAPGPGCRCRRCCSSAGCCSGCCWRCWPAGCRVGGRRRGPGGVAGCAAGSSRSPTRVLAPVEAELSVHTRLCAAVGRLG